MKFKIYLNVIFMTSFVSTFTLAQNLINKNNEGESSKALISKKINIPITDRERSSIEEGNIVLREIPAAKQAGRLFEGVGLIQGNLKQIYDVLYEYEKYPLWAPNVHKINISKTQDDYRWVDYTLKLQFGVIRKYRLELKAHKEQHDAKITWKMVAWPELKEDETINDTHGYWVLENYKKKANTILALYHIYTDYGEVPWGFGWIVDHMSKKSIPNLIQALRERVSDVYPK